MPILFSAVAKDHAVLNKFASCDGNFDEIVELVLAKFPNKYHKMTYLHGRYLFHYILENEHLYFCVTDKLCQRSRAFLFLNEIKRRFLKRTADFTTTLAEQMFTYNEDYNTITIRRGEIDEVNSIGVDSSESILGEKILVVRNDATLKYSTVSHVKNPPGEVVVSFKSPNFNITLIASLVIATICLSLMFKNPYIVIVVILIYFLSRNKIEKN